MTELDQTINERRKQTRSRIFHYMYDSPRTCSKQDIAADLGLSLPTVYQNLSELLEAGYIEYCGQKASIGGRPAMQLRAVYSAKSAIGINISSNCLRFASTDLSKTETGRRDVYHDFESDNPEYCRFIADQLELFIDDTGINRNTLLGVGITLAGIVRADSSDVIYAPTLSNAGFSLIELEKLIPYPVRTENDASSGGFAEWYNSDKGRCIAFLSLSDGVGGAVLVNGDQYPGNNNRSGEFGHMCIEYNGLPCSCGKRGCLEAYCSTRRLSDDLGLTLSSFFKNLAAGDPFCRSVWQDYVRYLSIGIHNIRMALDCEIILGGMLTEFLEPHMDDIYSVLSELDPFQTDCSYLSVSRYSRYSSMLGSALSFIRSFLESI